MTEVKCRSYLEEAEDKLCTMSAPMHNVSRLDAMFLHIQRREILPDLRQAAEALLLSWSGTAEQVDTVFRMWNRYESARVRLSV